jgi:probable rRNA maturation factor
MAHLLAHGILHLLGYDHAAEAEEREMRERERAVLAKAGIEAH